MKRLLYSLLAILVVLIACTKEEQAPDPPPTPTFTLNFSADTGGTVSTEGGLYNEGSKITVTATPDSMYLFKEWSDGSTQNPRVITVRDNLTIVALFEKTPELIYKESIIRLRTRVLEIIRSDGDPSWRYSFDLENDGDLDMILIRSGPASAPKKEMILFKNIDNIEFEEIPTGINCWGRTVVFDDFNGDGLTDFFVPDHGYDLPPHPGAQDQMIYQTPEGGLVEVTDQVLPVVVNWTHGASSLDIDNDGDRDIIVNQGGSQRVLRNENGKWDFWENGTDPIFEWNKHNINGHPIIDGEIRVDLWNDFMNIYWSGVGDFNNDGFDDVILGGAFADSSDPLIDGVNHRTVDMFNNILEKGDIVLLQDPNTGSLIYKYPESLIPNSWGGSGIVGVSIGILIDDFNKDGCDDYIGYNNSNSRHNIEFKYGDCDGGFSTIKVVELFVPSSGDTLWEDFGLVDIDNDGDLDVVISNSIQWSDTHLIPNEHSVFINENGVFNQRSGNSLDLIKLPPSIGVSWYLDGD